MFFRDSYKLHLVSVLELKKARDPKSPEQEIQTGLDCGYDGLSEIILSFTHSNYAGFQSVGAGHQKFKFSKLYAGSSQ